MLFHHSGCYTVKKNTEKMSKNGVSRHVFGPFLRISNICQQIRNFRDKHLISVAFERTECLLLHGTELYHSNFGICSTGCPKVMFSDTFVHRHVPVHFKVKFCLFFFFFLSHLGGFCEKNLPPFHWRLRHDKMT